MLQLQPTGAGRFGRHSPDSFSERRARAPSTANRRPQADVSQFRHPGYEQMQMPASQRGFPQQQMHPQQQMQMPASQRGFPQQQQQMQMPASQRGFPQEREGRSRQRQEPLTRYGLHSPDSRAEAVHKVPTMTNRDGLLGTLGGAVDGVGEFFGDAASAVADAVIKPKPKRHHRGFFGFMN
mmetsp:Transcript_63493/g.138117  ORF Transcript_63493/g.138117 Transcript_63493/m.138117 type:complete len:181 (+) Transcript_63493:207-749(+)